MGGRTSRGLARNGGVLWDFRWLVCSFRIRFSFAEDAFERRTGKPNEVTACVHVERDGLGRIGGQGERKSVIAARGKRERDLAMAVPASAPVEAGSGASGGRFEEVVGTVELVLLGKRVG